jgi:Transposase IS66 family
VKALEANDARAAVPLAAFKTLYDVEDAAKSSSAEERLRQRTQRSRRVYDELVAWCLRARARIMELTEHGNPMEMIGVVLSPSDGDRRCQNRRDPVEA